VGQRGPGPCAMQLLQGRLASRKFLGYNLNMRQGILAVISVFIVVSLFLGSMFMSNSAAADPIVPQCTITALGTSNNVSVTCVDPVTGATLGPNEIDLNVVGNQVVVTVPGEVITETVQIPGPTRTVTIRPAPVRVTKTVTPAPVRVTETATVVRTETVRPAPVRITRTATVTPEPVRITETVSPSGQDTPDRDTLDDDSGDDGFFSPKIDFGDGSVTAGEVGLGLLSIIGLTLVGLLAVYAGYAMGRKASKDEDTDFMRTLLDSVKINR